MSSFDQSKSLAPQTGESCPEEDMFPSRACWDLDMWRVSHPWASRSDTAWWLLFRPVPSIAVIPGTAALPLMVSSGQFPFGISHITWAPITNRLTESLELSPHPTVIANLSPGDALILYRTLD